MTFSAISEEVYTHPHKRRLRPPWFSLSPFSRALLPTSPHSCQLHCRFINDCRKDQPVCARLCVSVCTSLYTLLSVCLCVCVSAYISVCASLWVCMYVSLCSLQAYLCTWLCLSVSIYAHMPILEPLSLLTYHLLRSLSSAVFYSFQRFRSMATFVRYSLKCHSVMTLKTLSWNLPTLFPYASCWPTSRTCALFLEIFFHP